VSQPNRKSESVTATGSRRSRATPVYCGTVEKQSVNGDDDSLALGRAGAPGIP
jgi:hypothetical protein